MLRCIISIINRYSRSFDNLVCRFDVSLPLVTGQLQKNKVDVIISVAYLPSKMVKISRQPIITHRIGSMTLAKKKILFVSVVVL